VGCSSRGLQGQRRVGNPQNSRAEFVDDQRSQDWDGTHTEFGNYRVDIEPRTGRGRMIEV